MLLTSASTGGRVSLHFSAGFREIRAHCNVAFNDIFLYCCCLFVVSLISFINTTVHPKMLRFARSSAFSMSRRMTSACLGASVRTVVIQRDRGAYTAAQNANNIPTASDRPRFEISEVHDDPSKGYLLRVVLDDRRVGMTFYPQLGPRKSDPMDPAPQFDFAARKVVKLFMFEAAGLLSVCEGMAAQHRVRTSMVDMAFEKSERGYSFAGTVGRSSATHPISLRFEGYQATQLRHFLNSALVESFGFKRHFKFLESRNTQNEAKVETNVTYRSSNQNSRSASRK